MTEPDRADILRRGILTEKFKPRLIVEMGTAVLIIFIPRTKSKKLHAHRLRCSGFLKKR